MKSGSSVAATISESAITSRDLEDQDVVEEVGGPSLLINGNQIPRLMKTKTGSYELVSNPRFEFCFEV